MPFRHALSLVIIISLTTGIATQASAETIRLTTGEVLIGEVLSADFTQLTVQVAFPTDRKLTLSAKQLAPETMYNVLATRLSRTEAGPRLQLAEFCLESGLYAHAIVEARTAAKIDESKKERAKAIESEALEGIAAALLDEAKTQIAIDAPELASMYLQSLVGRYPNTKAAKEAHRLLKNLPDIKTPAAKPTITEAKQKDALRKKFVRAKKYYEKAEKLTNGMRRHFQANKKDEHTLRRAEPFYRKASSLIRSATQAKTNDKALNKALGSLAVESRSKLAKVNLELGSIYLGRGSINLAEEYCARACKIEPENKELHSLHRRIMDARIALRFGR